jgi:hypothetical protein
MYKEKKQVLVAFSNNALNESVVRYSSNLDSITSDWTLDLCISDSTPLAVACNPFLVSLLLVSNNDKWKGKVVK